LKLDGTSNQFCSAVPPGSNVTDHLNRLDFAGNTCRFEISLEDWAVEYFFARITELDGTVVSCVHMRENR
jgi:hypothetical protein